jgi:hypothetical protein
MTCWRNSSAAGSRRRSADHLRQISRTRVQDFGVEHGCGRWDCEEVSRIFNGSPRLLFPFVEKLNVGSPAPQLWGKPGFATRVFATRVFAMWVFMHLDEPRRYPHGLLPEFPAQAAFPLPLGFPQREGDCCDGPDRGHPGRDGAPLHGAHIAIMGDRSGCPTGPNGSKDRPVTQAIPTGQPRQMLAWGGGVRPALVRHRGRAGPVTRHHSGAASRRTDTHRRAADWARTADRGQNAAKITVL